MLRFNYFGATPEIIFPPNVIRTPHALICVEGNPIMALVHTDMCSPWWWMQIQSLKCWEFIQYWHSSTRRALLWNQTCIPEQINSRLNSDDACCQLVQEFKCSCELSANMKIKIYKNRYCYLKWVWNLVPHIIILISVIFNSKTYGRNSYDSRRKGEVFPVHAMNLQIGAPLIVNSALERSK